MNVNDTLHQGFLDKYGICFSDDMCEAPHNMSSRVICCLNEVVKAANHSIKAAKDLQMKIRYREYGVLHIK